MKVIKTTKIVNIIEIININFLSIGNNWFPILGFLSTSAFHDGTLIKIKILNQWKPICISKDQSWEDSAQCFVTQNFWK